LYVGISLAQKELETFTMRVGSTHGFEKRLLHLEASRRARMGWKYSSESGECIEEIIRRMAGGCPDNGDISTPESFVEKRIFGQMFEFFQRFATVKYGNRESV
jgi:hypothetical protein